LEIRTTGWKQNDTRYNMNQIIWDGERCSFTLGTDHTLDIWPTSDSQWNHPTDMYVLIRFELWPGGLQRSALTTAQTKQEMSETGINRT